MPRFLKAALENKLPVVEKFLSDKNNPDVCDEVTSTKRCKIQLIHFVLLLLNFCLANTVPTSTPPGTVSPAVVPDATSILG